MSEKEVHDLLIQLAVVETRQKAHAEAIDRLEQKVDKMQGKMMALVAAVASLAAGGGAVAGNLLQGLL